MSFFKNINNIPEAIPKEDVPIGESRTIHEVTGRSILVQVHKHKDNPDFHDPCLGCVWCVRAIYFADDIKCMLKCLGSNRKDSTDVIFKEVTDIL